MSVKQQEAVPERFAIPLHRGVIFAAAPAAIRSGSSDRAKLSCCKPSRRVCWYSEKARAIGSLSTAIT